MSDLATERDTEDFPEWFKLILQHQRDGHLALTLPFLLGASNQPVGYPFANEVSARRAHADLLRDIGTNLPESHLARIFKCPRLCQPVLSLTPVYYRGAFDWGHADRSTPRFYVQPTYLERSDGSDSAADRLWSLIREPVLTGRFSFRDHAYHPFDVHDEDFIAKALAYDMDY